MEFLRPSLKTRGKFPQNAIINSFRVGAVVNASIILKFCTFYFHHTTKTIKE